jgi:hypothetical protein
MEGRATYSSKELRILALGAHLASHAASPPKGALRYAQCRLMHHLKAPLSQCATQMGCRMSRDADGAGLSSLGGRDTRRDVLKIGV